VGLLLAVPALAQEDQPPEGTNWGDYHVNQTIEFGGRATSFTGNNDVYDTFVNLGPGVRLFNETLEMRSNDHNGPLFDNLFISNFGYGGDPNDFSTLRLSKDKWYDFTGTYRRDRNLWNYDLLANPLNPTTSNPAFIANFSPHDQALTRQMGDYNLTLLPQSSVRFRLGYSHNINEGPSLTTFHQGTEGLIFQDFKVSTNAYQVGVDFKVLPRTNISYDQFLNYYKGDTTQGLDNSLVPVYQLSNGQVVNLGITWDTSNNSPCKKPIVNGSTTPPTASPTCNAYTNYLNTGPVRTSYPTEQVSFQSNYFKNVDMSGRLVYSSADARVMNSDWLFQGFESRTSEVQSSATGPAAINRTTVSADYDVTFNVTEKFRIADEFRFTYFRIPGQNELSTADLYSTSMEVAPVVFNPATCTPPYKGNPSCPPIGGDNGTAISSLFLGEDSKYNTLQFEYDFNKRFGARLGYRYGHRLIDARDVALSTTTYDPIQASNCKGQPNPVGPCTVDSSSSSSYTTTINEHSLLAGFWARPMDDLRLTYDQELFYADNTFTRISPRQSQHYKFRAQYKPVEWLSMATTFNIYEARNNVSQIDHLEHTRSLGYNITIAPKDRWSIEAGYDYTGIFSQTDICYVFGSGPPPAGTPPCPITGSPVPLGGVSIYNSKLNYAFADLLLKPVKRVTLRMGYAIDSVTGNTLILDPNSPSGPLDFNYHRPYGSLDVALAKGVTWRTGWGFYDYNEKDSPIDPTGPRSFRGNLVNLSLVYSF
jgi:hypothetical protein